MPRAQDFSQSVIYHIRNKETKEVIYVGSTTSFQQRKAKHKSLCNKPNDNKPCYVHIRENGGWDFFEIIPVEFLNLENKTQLFIAEQAEMDKHDILKNKHRSHRTEEDIKEYDMSTKTKKQLTSAAYNLAHKEELKTRALYRYYKKTYGEQAILDCGGLDNLRFILKKEKIKIKSDLLKRNLYDYLKENP
tara:strand:- start:3255 stop:3824 length:570 start_codon:yes stop_codon:yes gene_type:complete